MFYADNSFVFDSSEQCYSQVQLQALKIWYQQRITQTVDTRIIGSNVLPSTQKSTSPVKNIFTKHRFRVHGKGYS